MTDHTIDGLAALLTAEEAARRLHVSRNKVYWLIRAGELRSLKIGGSRRITEEAIADLIERLETAS